MPDQTVPEHTQPGPGSVARLRFRGPMLILLALVVLAIALVATFLVGRSQRPDSAAAALAATSATETTGEQPSTSDIYAALAPSVVAIDAVRQDDSSSTSSTSSEPAPTEPATEPSDTAETGSASPPIFTAASGSSGTGVVINVDGSILTALHVVDNAVSIQVTFADGTRSAAAIAAADPATDMAVLVVDTLPTVVVPAVLGSSAGLSVGDEVIAIGNPLGLIDSTTTGVVSGLDRSASRPDTTDLQGLIQFDAAVNEGSSGGPLVNARGETVGIVVALANPTEDHTFIGIGFAVPIGTAVAAGGPPPPK